MGACTSSKVCGPACTPETGMPGTLEWAAVVRAVRMRTCVTCKAGWCGLGRTETQLSSLASQSCCCTVARSYSWMQLDAGEEGSGQRQLGGWGAEGWGTACTARCATHHPSAFSHAASAPHKSVPRGLKSSSAGPGSRRAASLLPGPHPPFCTPS